MKKQDHAIGGGVSGEISKKDIMNAQYMIGTID
jgi:hypothetical protein